VYAGTAFRSARDAVRDMTPYLWPRNLAEKELALLITARLSQIHRGKFLRKSLFLDHYASISPKVIDRSLLNFFKFISSLINLQPPIPVVIPQSGI
jgi:hypothetical protein